MDGVRSLVASFPLVVKQQTAADSKEQCKGE
jgi:hypothetical protein